MKKTLLSFVAMSALATTQLSADVRVSGFMNVVAGVNNLDDGKKDIINGYDNKYDFQNDSLAAVQFNGSIADNMGAVVQLIAQKSEVDDDIHMEWGYAYYDATDELRILAGRIRPSLFLYSNYLDVGYAYTWITPPSEVYYQAQITNLDGVNATYNLELDDSTVTFNVYGGNSSGKKVNPADGSIMDFSYDSIAGAEIAYINDYMKIRAGYTRSEVTNNTNVFPDTTPAAVVRALEFSESNAAFYGVGISVDYEGILFASELIQRDMDETVAPDVTSYYAMLGYKIGAFTPNFTYAVADSDIDLAHTGTAAIDAAIDTQRAKQLDDRTSTIYGLKYDLNDAAALKVEFKHEYVTATTYNNGSLDEKKSYINTYRVALNVVF